MPPNSTQARIACVDGLRAVAVLLVVVSHAWDPPHAFSLRWRHNLMVPHPGTLLDVIVSRGYQGVSLFLVLSGFCLSYPILRRRAEGNPAWFSPSLFFARRCVRILPPYYVALAICTLLMWTCARNHWPLLGSIGSSDISWANLLTHIALIHNFTPFGYSINWVFWSLALEWQWYWLFPLVLVCCIRWPIATLALCLVVSMSWQAISHDVPEVMSWVPGRLFEFACGVVVARLVVHCGSARFQCRTLIAAALLCIGVAEYPLGHWVGDIGLYQPLYGIAWSCVLLLSIAHSRFNAWLSGSLITTIGVASYSIYLVHLPTIRALQAADPGWLRGSYALFPLSAVLGVAVGFLFHLAVERPSISPSTWKRVSPLLMRVLRWTDRIYTSTATLSAVPRTVVGAQFGGSEGQLQSDVAAVGQ